MARIGVIADTHGLLRPEVFEVFREVDHILHAGDVGPASLLEELETIAPVTAVYGNTDGREVRGRLPVSPPSSSTASPSSSSTATSSAARRRRGSRPRSPPPRSSSMVTPTARCSPWSTSS